MLSDTFCVKDLDYGGEKARRDSRQRALTSFSLWQQQSSFT